MYSGYPQLAFNFSKNFSVRMHKCTEVRSARQWTFTNSKMPTNLWRLFGSRQSHCSNNQAYVFGSLCIAEWTRVDSIHGSGRVGSGRVQIISLLSGSGRVQLCGSAWVTLDDTKCSESISDVRCSYTRNNDFIKSKFAVLLPVFCTN